MGIFLSFFSALTLFVSGEPLDIFLSMLGSSTASFSYEYSVKRSGSPEVKGHGRSVMQGRAYRTEADGLEIYCDGTVVWTVDRAAREVVIEAYDSSADAAEVNPLSLLRQFGELFSVASVSEDGGTDIRTYRLEAGPSSNIRELVAGIAVTGDRIAFARLELKDGTVIDCTIPSFSFSSAVDSRLYTFDVSTLDSNYIITDLR